MGQKPHGKGLVREWIGLESPAFLRTSIDFGGGRDWARGPFPGLFLGASIDLG